MEARALSYLADAPFEMGGDPTLADAILDRLVHNAYKVTLKGESMRKKRKRLDQNPQS